MIANLFSVFDPSSDLGYPVRWLRTFLGVFILPCIFWTLPNRYLLFFNKLIILLHNEIKVLVGSSYLKGHTLIFLSFFVFIVFNNFIGLYPYVFTATRHLSLTLSLALPLWLGLILYGWFNNTKHMLAHLVPLGTPAVLMPFIVLIETVRNIIRPGTLAVRLAANIIAGHLLLVLLGNQGPTNTRGVVTILLVVQVALLTLEAAVAVIQSYVFAVLASLYSREV